MDEPKRTSKLKLICEYDGSAYSGWAKSPSNTKPCVSEKIEQSWRKLFPNCTFLSVKASSRTDSGVHALGQVVTIESDVIFGETSALKTEKRPGAVERRLLKKMARSKHSEPTTEMPIEPGLASEAHLRLNGYLPDDVVFKSSKLVANEFSAKDCSVRRMYRYEIYNHPIRCAVGRNYVWHIKTPLDTEAMAQAAEKFIGKRDLSCFCPKAYLPENPAKLVKTIESSKVIVSEDKTRITYEVIGSSFMYKQVRNMVGMLVEVGQGKMTLERVQQILDEAKKEAIQGAPAQGLTLVWVEHKENIEATPTEHNNEMIHDEPL